MKTRYMSTFFSATGVIHRTVLGHILPALLLVFFLAGCAGVGEKVEKAKTFARHDKTFARHDIEVARQIAVQQGDIISSTCYQAILDRTPKDQEKIEPVGPISRLQVAAGLLHKFEDAISDELALGCAAKYLRIKSIKMKISRVLVGR